MCGIASDKTRSRLLKQAKLTLPSALDICRADEATVLQLKSMSSVATTATPPVDGAEVKLLSRQKEIKPQGLSSNEGADTVEVDTNHTKNAVHVVLNATNVVDETTSLKCADQEAQELNPQKSRNLTMRAQVKINCFSMPLRVLTKKIGAPQSASTHTIYTSSLTLRSM